MAIVLTLGGSRASAHHAASATYLHGKTVTVEGTLKEFVWRNPQSFMKVEAPDDKGETQLWLIEGAAPTQLAEGGVTKKIRFRPGDHVIVTGQPGAWLTTIECCSRKSNGRRTASSGKVNLSEDVGSPIHAR